jgi:hypothetical protein
VNQHTTPSKVSNSVVDSKPVKLANGVIYQEAIYKNWPYTEPPAMSGVGADEQISVAVKEATIIIEEKIEVDIATSP